MCYQFTSILDTVATNLARARSLSKSSSVVFNQPPPAPPPTHKSNVRFSRTMEARDPKSQLRAERDELEVQKQQKEEAFALALKQLDDRRTADFRARVKNDGGIPQSQLESLSKSLKAGSDRNKKELKEKHQIELHDIDAKIAEASAALNALSSPPRVPQPPKRALDSPSVPNTTKKNRQRPPKPPRTTSVSTSDASHPQLSESQKHIQK